MKSPAFYASLFMACACLLCSLLILWDTYQLQKAVKRLLTPPKDRKPIFPHDDAK